MTVSRILAVNQQYRSTLAAGEAKAVKQLGNAYGLAWRSIEERLEALGPQIDALAAEDLEPDELARRIFQEARYQELQRQLALEMDAIEQIAKGVITQQQQLGASLGRDGALDQIRAAYGQRGIDQLDLTRLPNDALKDLIGFTADGSPLRDTLDRIGLDASARIRNSLLEGIVLGENPLTIASRMKDAFGGNLARSMTVSRTELLRSYRTSNLRWAQANKDIVREWVWMSAQDERTCLSCLAMHGKRFPVTEPFGSHQNCRCTPTLLPRNSRVGNTIQPSEDWLRSQDEQTQREVFGPAAHRAWKSGAVSLDDFVKVTNDKDWGMSRSVRSLRSILGAKQAREFLQAAD